MLAVFVADCFSSSVVDWTVLWLAPLRWLLLKLWGFRVGEGPRAWGEGSFVHELPCSRSLGTGQHPFHPGCLLPTEAEFSLILVHSALVSC